MVRQGVAHQRCVHDQEATNQETTHRRAAHPGAQSRGHPTIKKQLIKERPLKERPIQEWPIKERPIKDRFFMGACVRAALLENPHWKNQLACKCPYQDHTQRRNITYSNPAFCTRKRKPFCRRNTPQPQHMKNEINNTDHLC